VCFLMLGIVVEVQRGAQVCPCVCVCVCVKSHCVEVEQTVCVYGNEK